MLLHDRKRNILKAIVESYIDTAEPVGSKNLSTAFEQSISSATIRNEMSELEEMGFLEKPHVSSGRVPSYKAYRFYVNELMERYRATTDDLEMIRTQMKSKMQEIDNILLSASKVVSNLTGQVALSMSRQAEGARVHKCEIIQVDDSGTYAVILIMGDSVKSKVFHLENKLDDAAVALLSTAVNISLIDDKLDYMLTSIARSAGEHSEIFDFTKKIMDFIMQTQYTQEQPELYLEGVSRLLENREYQDAGKAKEVIEYITDKNKLRDVFDSGDTGIVNVKIGPELEGETPKDVSLLFSTYRIDAATQGIIGIVAPTRMDYSAAYSKLAAFIQTIESLEYMNDIGEKDGG